MKNFACFYRADIKRHKSLPGTEEGPSRAANFMATGCFFVKKMQPWVNPFFCFGCFFCLFGRVFRPMQNGFPWWFWTRAHGGLNPGADLGDGIRLRDRPLYPWRKN